MKRSNTGTIIMIALLAAIFGFSLGKFVDIESTYLVEKLQNQEIADMIEEGEGEDGEVKDINAKNEDGILKQYEEVYGRNNDFIGWLKVPDTNINYPVMYTPANVDMAFVDLNNPRNKLIPFARALKALQTFKNIKKVKKTVTKTCWLPTIS